MTETVASTTIVRVRTRFTAAEGAAVEALADLLGLRPAQVATRLLTDELTVVPLANRALWQSLSRTAANLTQLDWHLDDSVDRHQVEDVKARVAEVQALLARLREALLGVEGAP